ncbi:10412_t:CDS:2 [Funneliformis mosseae]|uniref:10412_t:CDS:1 n=1 Tax=Funneliformis mosseae TaxID=27381 RepID=A0A9N9CE14_FUNMO|nr:10412_t:CDS:2 [Funneliformis mosseae]
MASLYCTRNLLKKSQLQHIILDFPNLFKPPSILYRRLHNNVNDGAARRIAEKEERMKKVIGKKSHKNSEKSGLKTSTLREMFKRKEEPTDKKNERSIEEKKRDKYKQDLARQIQLHQTSRLNKRAFLLQMISKKCNPNLQITTINAKDSNRKKKITPEEMPPNDKNVNYEPNWRENANLPGWLRHKFAMKERTGFKKWEPHKKVNRETMDKIRWLHTQMPEEYTAEKLSQQFKISPESIRRILKSNFVPNSGMLEPSEPAEILLTFPEGDHTTPLIIIGGIACGSILVQLLLTYILRQIAVKTGWTFDNEIVKNCSLPTFFLFPISSIVITLSFISIAVEPTILEPIRHALDIFLIIFATWTAIGFVKAASISISKNNDFIKSSNSVQSRKLHTQLIVTTRLIYGLIFCIGASAILLTFPRAWEIGASILASASVAALFIGLAAKPSMENLVASLQIALTQPLLLDDYVMIDGQEGIVEEIQAQYIVVRTGDDRRIIVPLSRVINETFENWSKSNENIGMHFEFFVDYGVPLEDLKQYYNHILQKSECWDRRDGGLSIKECRENCMVLKAYMTGELREKMIEYLVTTHPEYLPYSRYLRVEKRRGIDSMKRIVTKMEDANLDDGITGKKHFIIQEKE